MPFPSIRPNLLLQQAEKASSTPVNLIALPRAGDPDKGIDSGNPDSTMLLRHCGKCQTTPKRTQERQALDHLCLEVQHDKDVRGTSASLSQLSYLLLHSQTSSSNICL